MYNKYIHHPLEAIYNFNYQKYDNKYAKTLDKFFKQVLKYSQLTEDYTTLPEKKTILFMVILALYQFLKKEVVILL